MFLPVKDLLRHIRQAGRVPVERDTLFNVIDQPGGATAAMAVGEAS
jgi:2-iminoacetate synthase ThiH